MKNLMLRTALILATTAVTMTSFAGEPATPLPDAAIKSMERELSRQVNKHVTYPIFDRGHHMDGEVSVTFVIDIEGKVQVISANSKNQALCEYVLSKLAKVDIGDNPNGLWRTTHMRFVFHPEV